jgi:DNA-binding Lrp family transcriptional regulator
VGEMISIDRLDAEILGQLDSNARKGVAELASDLGVSRNTIQLRMRKLEESGVLRGFRPEVDLAAIGVGIQAFISLELDQRRLNEVVEQLARIPEVLQVGTQAGREDLVVHVAAISLQDIPRLTEAMVNIPGVRQTNTSLAVSTPLPYRIKPLLDHLTRDKGYGRSTPLPQ